MKATLFAERSSGTQSLALVAGGAVVKEAVLEGADCRSGDWALRVRDFIGGAELEAVCAGTGPGSFAGVRAALAFAQGYAAGADFAWLSAGRPGAAAPALSDAAPQCEVLGMPSPCAMMRQGLRTAVIGDARRGSLWVALLDGFTMPRGIFQTDAAGLREAVPPDYVVATPDAARIGALLAEVFGEDAVRAEVPLAGGLARAALANPALLSHSPSPVYLNPAVRG